VPVRVPYQSHVPRGRKKKKKTSTRTVGSMQVRSTRHFFATRPENTILIDDHAPPYHLMPNVRRAILILRSHPLPSHPVSAQHQQRTDSLVATKAVSPTRTSIRSGFLSLLLQECSARQTTAELEKGLYPSPKERYTLFALKSSPRRWSPRSPS
jgi:hypothetical protein